MFFLTTKNSLTSETNENSYTEFDKSCLEGVNKNRITLFDVAVFLITLKIITSVTVYFSFPKRLQDIMMIVSYLFIFLHIVSKKYNIKTILWIFLITILMLYSSYKMKNMYYLATWGIFVGTINYDLRRVVAVMFFTILSVFIAVSIFSLIVYLLGYDKDILINIRRGDVRSFMFGFVHSNMFSITLSSLCLMYIWIIRNNIKLYHMLVLILIQIIGFHFTKTRTSILIFLFISAFVLLKNIYSIKVLGVIRYLFILIGVVHLYLSRQFVYGNKLSLIVDSIITGRLKYASYAMNNFGFTMLGKYLDTAMVWDEVWRLNSFTFDSAYSFIFFNAGVIWFIIISIAMIKLISRLDKIEIILMMAWILYSITETDTLIAQFGFQLLFFCRLFDSKHLSEKNLSERISEKLLNGFER